MQWPCSTNGRYEYCPKRFEEWEVVPSIQQRSHTQLHLVRQVAPSFHFWIWDLAPKTRWTSSQMVARDPSNHAGTKPHNMRQNFWKSENQQGPDIFSYRLNWRCPRKIHSGKLQTWKVMSFKTQRKQLGIIQQDHTALPRLIAQILKPCMNMQLTCHVNPWIWWEPCMRSTSQFWNSAEVCFTANSKQILGGEHFCTGAFHRVVATPPQISGKIFFLGWDPAPVDTSINVLNELKTLGKQKYHCQRIYNTCFGSAIVSRIQ